MQQAALSAGMPPVPQIRTSDQLVAVHQAKIAGRGKSALADRESSQAAVREPLLQGAVCQSIPKQR